MEETSHILGWDKERHWQWDWEPDFDSGDRIQLVVNMPRGCDKADTVRLLQELANQIHQDKLTTFQDLPLATSVDTF